MKTASQFKVGAIVRIVPVYDGCECLVRITSGSFNKRRADGAAGAYVLVECVKRCASRAHYQDRAAKEGMAIVEGLGIGTYVTEIDLLAWHLEDTFQ